MRFRESIVNSYLPIEKRRKMFVTRRDPYHSCCVHSRRNPLHQFNRLQKELDEVLSPALYILQQLGNEVKDEVQPTRTTTTLAQTNKNVFEIKTDVHNFVPEELSVKMVNNFIEIEGKHEEKEDDHGFISRQFTRRYAIPEDVRQEEITCNLTSDGVLVLSAPRIVQQPQTTERKIAINVTGQPAVQNKPVVEEELTKQTQIEGEQVEEPMAA